MKRAISFFQTMALTVMVTMALFACSKNEPGDPESPTSPRLLVLNEGNYSQGNASMTLVTVKDSVMYDVFRKANNNRPLGDGAQSATKIGKKLYVCVNNSGKVEVMDVDSYQSISTILLEGANPMYMVQLNDSLAAVSNLYTPKLHIINIKNDRLSRTIDLPNPGEQMAVVGGYLVVSTVSPWVDMTSPRTESLTVFDRNTLALKANVQIDGSLLFNYGKLCVDGGGKIWKMVSNKVVVFDPATQKVTETLTLPSTVTLGWTTRYDMTPDRRFIFVADGANTVQRLSLDDKAFVKAFEMKEVKSFYNLACSSTALVVTDAEDYLSSGTVFEYKFDGTLLNQFKAGINPQFVFFTKE